MRLRTFGGLWIDAAEPVPPLGARRMALLALVASAGKRGTSRERLIGILWGEASEEQARHSLSQNLYTLRRETGRDWIVLSPKLCLNHGATSDIGEFLEAAESSDHERAAELYTGTFLQDFHLTGAAEFERWVEEERATLRRTALRSIETLAGRAGAAGKLEEASAWWRRATEIDGLNGQYAAGLIRCLSASGDLVAALAHARIHEDVVRRELEADVDPTVRALATSLRARAGVQLTTPADDAPSDRLIVSGSTPAKAPLTSSHRLKRIAAILAIVGVTLFVAPRLASTLFDPLRRPSTPFDAARTLAVGEISSTDSASTSAILRDMLATSLGGIRDLSVVDNSRLVELMPKEGDSLPGTIIDAARRAGAGEIFEGEMVAVPEGFRLNLRRVSLNTGVVLRGYAVVATDPARLVDSAAAAIARDLGVQSPTRSVTTTRTASPVAYALYERGLQALYRGEGSAAHNLMRAAIEHDSTFAMAAYYGWVASLRSPFDRDSDLLNRARRLALRAIDRERLLIAGSVSYYDSSVTTTVAIADTLAVRYPRDPEAQMLLGLALWNRGDFALSAAAFNRAVAIDSAAGALTGPFCRLCSALSQLSDTYLWWDSLDASVRTARRSVALRPDEAGGWHDLAEPLFRLGRRAEAITAFDRHEAMTSPNGGSREALRRDMIRWGDFEEVDRQLIADLRNPSPDVRGSSRWLLLISLRNQGRLREAKALAWDRIIPGTTTVAEIETETLHQMLLAMETGKPEETARRFRETATKTLKQELSPGIRARMATWYLTQAGTALAVAGDTAGLRRIADSVEQIGRESAFGRDTRSHHYLRGLLLQKQGLHAEAVLEFRSAVHSLTDGYTRINFEMARCLIQLGRGAEAVAVLSPALRGGVDGSNSFITHTELHETIAQAFEAAGLRDSARVHYAAVERAWRHADPQFAARYALAKAKSAGS